MGNEGKYVADSVHPDLPQCDVPTDLNPHYRAGAADVTDGQPTITKDLDHPEAVDEAMIADAHAKLSDELDSEEDAGYESLQGRLFTWLSQQPDVSDLDNLGMGIFGFNLAGTGGISLTVTITP